MKSPSTGLQRAGCDICYIGHCTVAVPWTVGTVAGLLVASLWCCFYTFSMNSSSVTLAWHRLHDIHGVCLHCCSRRWSALRRVRETHCCTSSPSSGYWAAPQISRHFLCAADVLYAFLARSTRWPTKRNCSSTVSRSAWRISSSSVLVDMSPSPSLIAQPTQAASWHAETPPGTTQWLPSDWQSPLLWCILG